MISLLAETRGPASLAFIGAVDQTMNSNTVLLKVRADEPLTSAACVWTLDEYLRAPLFTTMMLEVAQSQGSNYHEWVEVDGEWVERPFLGSFVRENGTPSIRRVSVLSFAERLHWMLRTAFSPYQTHVSEEQAQVLIPAFLAELFGRRTWNGDSRPAAGEWVGPPDWIRHPWAFYDVRPDFLHVGPSDRDETEGEAGEDRPSTLPYFAGFSSDSCTFFYREDVFYLLLTNGAP